MIVCMIYYPLEAGVSKQKSWAGLQLGMLGYNRSPGQLQMAIRQMYRLATKKVEVEGVEVVPCALVEALDGKREGEYTARVEPSAEGGRKMALLLKEIIEGLLAGEGQH